MIIVVSPAKTLDFETPATTKKHTQPEFLDDAQQLINQLRDLSPNEVGSMMKISDQLAGLNVARFQQWQTPFTPDNAKQAVLAFKGDVYTGLEAEQFNAQDFTLAQKHLRILSGLYGLLRPLDLIQPYRLEMGTRFSNSGGKDLYEFWDGRITTALNAALKKERPKVLINLASNEYFKAVKKPDLDAEVITPIFKDYKNGQYKIISFFAKKARGRMSAFIIKNRITDPEGIKEFDWDGYQFEKSLSKGNDWVFTRKEAG